MARSVVVDILAKGFRASAGIDEGFQHGSGGVAEYDDLEVEKQ
jgi:hypothetical protein